PDAGGANLRKAVHFARRALGGEQAISSHDGSIDLWPGGPVTSDVERFTEASRRAALSRDPEAFREAADLYPDDLLAEDSAEPWSEERRQGLHDGYLNVLRGARLWGRILELDPTDEEAHRELMRGYLEAGNRQAAMRQFERLREALELA